MNNELKRAIVNFILDNEKEFQLTNTVVNEFKAYVYNEKGNFLIGGEDVSNFIRNSIKLLLK